MHAVGERAAEGQLLVGLGLTGLLSIICLNRRDVTLSTDDEIFSSSSLSCTSRSYVPIFRSGILNLSRAALRRRPRLERQCDGAGCFTTVTRPALPPCTAASQDSKDRTRPGSHALSTAAASCS